MAVAGRSHAHFKRVGPISSTPCDLRSRAGRRATVALAVAAVFVSASSADAAFFTPTTLVPSIHSGRNVDATTGADVCTVASGDECRVGRRSDAPGGFRFLTSVAVNPSNGDVYVSENGTSRVQELTSTGTFVAMFGWDVNKTMDLRRSATQPEKDVCAAASGDVCGAGVGGTAAEQLTYPASVAVAPAGGDVYVAEIGVDDFRVDKYTAAGRFVWTAGRRVNLTTGANLCTEREIEQSHVRCGSGGENLSASLEPSAFKLAQTEGNLLAVGGPEGLLYVGDEHRVQEFEADGRWKRELLLASLSAEPESHVVALTLDRQGDLYLVYQSATATTISAGAPQARDEQAEVVHEFDRRGEQVGEFEVAPRQSGAVVDVDALAFDPDGALAVFGYESPTGGSDSPPRLAALYDARTGRLIADFDGPSDNDGIAFNRDGDLYVAATDDQEVIAYVPAPLVGLVSSPTACEVDSSAQGTAAFDCVLAAS